MTSELIDLDVTDVAHGGVFVGRHEGRVVFVPDAIPGERVRVRLTDVHKSSFWRGEVVEILDASPHRCPHVWPAADVDAPPEHRPGGADFGHIDLAHQRELKLRVVEDALRRIGGVALQPTITAPDGETADGTRWRTRVSLHVDADGSIGPYAARSHRVVAASDLPLATEAIEQAARELDGLAPGRVDLVQPADCRVRVIPRPARTGGGSRMPARNRRAGRTAARPPRDTGREPARETVIERVGDREFRVDAGGFWQVHRLAARTLTDAVAAALDGAVDPDAAHLDLYGGVGLFAAALGEAGGTSTRITTVEADARATEHAGANLAEWLGARAETSRVDRFLARLDEEASGTHRERLRRGVVVLDPPRAGAGREVVEGVAGIRPETVVYVACDPVALARDLATFRAVGYDTASVQAFDLFPNSHHVEAVAVLHRA